MLNIIIIVVAILSGGYLAFSRRLSRSSSWQATVTPLASIMGSGFLAIICFLVFDLGIPSG